MVVLVVDGEQTGLLHRSVLDRVVEIADRLDCRGAVRLGALPVSFSGAGLRRLRRDIDQVVAFSDATLRTGWTLGTLAVAPGDRPVPVAKTSEGTLWADSLRGFELHGPAGPQRVVTHPQLPATAHRTPLSGLTAPLVEAVAPARHLEVFERVP
ncbi:hypothetical protein NE236_29775 [Actinoallomurus purpureus]|uniref:hypothetical protein n=1 Tax=Actinoallomurus purpureus TaxID=478114 RepID=UPI002092B157|nr:hypothetical protein [Actinoallomurus purpureus]MCO6009166.1 hypothetical protein [Actinoallomurus purpureus]